MLTTTATNRRCEHSFATLSADVLRAIVLAFLSDKDLKQMLCVSKEMSDLAKIVLRERLIKPAYLRACLRFTNVSIDGIWAEVVSPILLKLSVLEMRAFVPYGKDVVHPKHKNVLLKMHLGILAMDRAKTDAELADGRRAVTNARDEFITILHPWARNK